MITCAASTRSQSIVRSSAVSFSLAVNERRNQTPRAKQMPRREQILEWSPWVALALLSQMTQKDRSASAVVLTESACHVCDGVREVMYGGKQVQETRNT
jgi:hypothetical protein